jgi:hypothetical protein
LYQALKAYIIFGISHFLDDRLIDGCEIVKPYEQAALYLQYDSLKN